MNETDVLEVARQGIFVTLTIAAPIMGVALVVGIVISLIQALTQIQEMTLVFVPKIIAVFLVILLLFPFMLSTLSTYTRGLFDKIVTLP